MESSTNNNKNHKTKNYKIYVVISAWSRKKPINLKRMKIPSRRKKKPTKKKSKLS